MKAKKILIVFIIIMSLSLVLQINKVQAALQANGDTIATKNRDTWMTEVRQMESIGGTLGLKETQNADLTSSSGSNNLDIHMQKNTEYGAMALLSASAYGKPTKIENGETTTGNETGVVIPYNIEWTAAQYNNGYTDIKSSASRDTSRYFKYIGKTSYADRYINYYDFGEKKLGDATIETKGWHSTNYINAEYYEHGSIGHGPYGLTRGSGKGIFSFDNKYFQRQGYYTYSNNFNANITKTWATRAVIINGEGI